MKLPIINLNGTSPLDLLEQQTEVLLSIRVALDKLYLAAPHGRDYPVEDSYWRGAREEHFARVAKMREIMLEVESIAEHCSNAITARNEVAARKWANVYLSLDKK